MKDQISTLLLHESADSVGPLILALQGQSLRVRWMGNYQEAVPLLMGPNPPHLVFAESALPGGTWADVVKLAAEAQKPVNVVVVARLVDIRLYLEAIVGGAFDFIVPPLTGNELDHVVRCAAENVLSRREEQVHSAPLKTARVA
jgi:DNA-binding NtrC family response regulator